MENLTEVEDFVRKNQPLFELKRMIETKNEQTLEDEALWLSFEKYFDICVANIPVADINDCVLVAAHALPTLAYLKNNLNLLRNPKKLPTNIVDVALQKP